MPWRSLVIAGALLLLPELAEAQRREAPSSADAARWLVLPALLDDPEATASRSIEASHVTAEAVRQELSIRGEEIWPADVASERFEVVGSAPAPQVSQRDIDRWVERSRAAVRYLARADYKAARRELKAAQRLADRAAEELNREAARAQQVLDTCLFMVRAHVETNDDAEARRQARECRQLVPRVEPSAFRHTPEVRALLDEVDAEIEAEAPGKLDVTSKPSGCLVRINGVELGRTPLHGLELPVGRYRLQVECSEGVRGRIHRVAIESGPNAFSVDAALERAVRTRPVLHLRYGSAMDAARRPGHGEAVARTLGSRNVLVVASITPDTVRLDLAGEERPPASSWVVVRNRVVPTEDLRRAIDALLDARSIDFTGAHPIARASWAAEEQADQAAEGPAPVEPSADAQAEPERGAAPRPRAQRIAGWSLLGAGVVSIGASVGLHVWRGNLGADFAGAPSSLDAAQRWNDARIPVWTTAAFGGVATSAAMPLLLPEVSRPPWWAWLSGALGLGLTGYAVYEGVTMRACPEPALGDANAARECVDRGQEAGRVSLALAGAAPLLTVPLVYLFRPLRAEPRLRVRSGGAVLHLRRVF